MRTMDKPKCRLCGERHWGLCSRPAKAETPAPKPVPLPPATVPGMQEWKDTITLTDIGDVPVDEMRRAIIYYRKKRAAQTKLMRKRRAAKKDQS
jgi:hypothetical protein